MKKRIAIIGAGISGLTLGQQLKEHADITVFEKARGVGGRMSTRYADPFYFDHGTQYFTARSKEFQDFLTPWRQAGVVAEWSGKVIHLEIGKKQTKRLWFEPHLVSTPNMNSLCKKLAETLDVRLSVEVAPLLQKQSDTWVLQDKAGNVLGAYDWVISTAPPAQTARLMEISLPEDTALHHVGMRGCYALMIGFNRPWDKSWIAAKVRNNPIEWIAVNSSKPERNPDVTTIVVHSRHDWADEHMEDDIPQAQAFLCEQFELVTGISTADAQYISTHRWKYAIVEDKEKPGFYLDPTQQLAATSDWASTSRIEEVWLHANGLVNKMIEII